MQISFKPCLNMLEISLSDRDNVQRLNLILVNTLQFEIRKRENTRKMQKIQKTHH